ncbi:hypothetical protein HMPREF9103_01042 [Lentilactobacillus parafarraginis F0439]|uniref:Uncharacterized protein n=1 Tax=Lentilactobacillus parafarraginis F0439 TaxID=797515 RepID=G9ZMU2_9LACO|nr:hypothetical protein HMPREF9103_01042 [Lentilactobacillus parafarraginis F0439]
MDTFKLEGVFILIKQLLKVGCRILRLNLENALTLVVFIRIIGFSGIIYPS